LKPHHKPFLIPDPIKPEQHVPPSAERVPDPNAEPDKRIPPDEHEAAPSGGSNSETEKDALVDEASAEARTKEPQPKPQNTEGGGTGIPGFGI
jgi:hypothetical protein